MQRFFCDPVVRYLEFLARDFQHAKHCSVGRGFDPRPLASD